MKKYKFFTVLILTIFSIALTSSNITAAPTTVNGVTYELNETDKTATVTGYDSTESTYGPDLVIPANVNNSSVDYSVTIIDNYALNFKGLTSIKIPSSVHSINEHALSYNKLTNVVIADGVKIIGKSAFSNNELKSVTIPKSVTSIEHYAFNINSLETIFIPNLADFDSMIDLLNRDSMNGIRSSFVYLYALDNVVGDYVSGTKASYTIKAGDEQSLSTGVLYNPQLKKYNISIAEWENPDIANLPVTNPDIKWYKKSDTSEDSVVGSGVTYKATKAGTYYAKVNDFLQMHDIVIKVINDTIVNNKKGIVLVKHLDSKGKSIAKTNKLTGLIGTSYKTESKKIKGFKLVKKPSNVIGKFKATETSVVYIYNLVEDDINSDLPATGNNTFLMLVAGLIVASVLAILYRRTDI